MKRLMCTTVGQIAWEEVEEPALGPHDVKIRCQFGAEKHGTMTAFYKGYANQRGAWDWENNIYREGGMMWSYPIPLGNMQYGEVVEIGPEVTTLAVGDRAFVSHHFQPVIVCPEKRVRKLGGHVSWKSGMLLDPGEFAIGAVRDGHIRLGDRVAVFGLGAIGLVEVQALRAAGASLIVAIDPVEKRRAVAAESGAITLDPRGMDVGLELRNLTGGTGVDAVVDFSGSPHALQAAFRGVGYLGTIVCGAFPPPHTVGLDFGGEAHMNRPTIVFSRACSNPNPDHPRWDWVRLQSLTAQMIDAGQLNGDSIVDDPIPYDDLLGVYSQIAAAPEQSIKLSVAY